MYVCPVNSQSPQCEIKTCPANRKRRSLEEHPRMRRSTTDKPVFGYLPGISVKYEKKSKCANLKCPPNTTCYELFPAQCRADPGFIVSPLKNKTLSYNEDNMLRLTGVRFDLIWRSDLSDYESLDFHALAARTEEKLLSLLVDDFNITDVVAVKVEAARQGSVVVRYIYSH